jgi:hypothetical protein
LAPIGSDVENAVNVQQREERLEMGSEGEIPEPPARDGFTACRPCDMPDKPGEHL